MSFSAEVNSNQKDMDNFSLIIAMYNEEENVKNLIEKVEDALTNIKRIKNYEIICVDDGSTDETLKMLQLYKSKQTKIYTYNKNRGKSAAMSVGIKKAKFELLGFMDGDLQENPNDFEKLICKMTEGYDMVCGARNKRKDGIIKVVSTTLARKIRHIIIGDNYFDINCPLKIVKREALASLNFCNSFHRFIPILVEMQGYKVAEVWVGHYPRVAGYSKYGIGNRLWIGIKSAFAVRWMVKNYIILENVEQK